MSGIIKLERSKLILEKELSYSLENFYFEPKLARIRIEQRDGILLYIQYNNYNEYSYSIIFSKMLLDRCRFDNYDDKWNVSSRPNHFHPRYDKSGYSSPMNGDPDHDIILVLELIKSGKLLSPNHRFIK